MLTIRQKGGLSGFPDPAESSYDRVKTGHGGTSLTTAIGMALGIKNAGLSDGRKVIALVGDSGFQEGVAFEALNHGGSFDDLPLLIVLNDNEHGIGPAVGAMRKYFSMVRSGPIYRTAKRNFQRFFKTVERTSPTMGQLAFDVAERLKSGVTSLLPTVFPGALFEALGYQYYGPVDGHDIPTLLESLEACRSFARPVVLHCITTKGKGYSYQEDRLGYHSGNPSKRITAHLPNEFSCQGGPAYTNVFVDEAIAMAREDPRVVAITAAMLEGTGLVKFQQEFPERCFDVGMAEQHAVGMAQGLALAGQKPICAVYSTFMQRAVDQLFQEIALINTPVMLCLDRAGVVGPDGATHNGVFDIAYCRMFPNMVVMAPRDATELRKMMRLGKDHTGPTAIRYPRTNTPLPEDELPGQDFDIGEAELLLDGTDGCLLAYGAMVYPALDVARHIFERHGRRLAVVNARFAKPLDAKMLEREFNRQPVLFSLEDHMRSGGFGAAVLEHANAHGHDSTKLSILAIEDEWIDHGQRVEALAMAGLDLPSLVEKVERRLLTA
jgi:1-deoxy-D-xylulose-5-phosphate synthase